MGRLVLTGTQSGAFGGDSSVGHPGAPGAGWLPLGSTSSHPALTLQALWDFPHTTCAIPPEYLLDLIPRIRPRAFSIASSTLVRAQPFLATWPTLS